MARNPQPCARRLGDRPSMRRVRLSLRHEFVHRNRPLLRVAVTTPFDDFSDGVHASSDEVERVVRQVLSPEPRFLQQPIQAIFRSKHSHSCCLGVGDAMSHAGALISDVSVSMRKACQHRIVRLIN